MSPKILTKVLCRCFLVVFVFYSFPQRNDKYFGIYHLYNKSKCDQLTCIICKGLSQISPKKKEFNEFVSRVKL